MEGGPQELKLVKQRIVQPGRVEFGVGHAVLGIDILLEYSEREHGHGRVEEVINGDKHRVQYGLEGNTNAWKNRQCTITQ